MKVIFKSPLGPIHLDFSGDALTALRFYNSETVISESCETAPVRDVFDWLDAYFDGKNPSVENLNFRAKGTAFQERVWHTLIKIPYGYCVSYGYLAKLAMHGTEKGRMLARAVGNAMARNPIWIIIPCHRVIRSSGETGFYGGGAEMKKALLKLENCDFMDHFIK